MSSNNFSFTSFLEALLINETKRITSCYLLKGEVTIEVDISNLKAAILFLKDH
jgi:hypothetical protein